ncbi:MAG: hypothetical protein KF894_12115 [Labilithrix sp.]|nr:hypothetical protein [Labilithrix sp.]
MRHTAEWWSERVAELAATGGARGIARRHGVRERMLTWWRSELRRRTRDRARGGASPRLLPVVVKAPPAVPKATDELEVFVEIGSMRGEVRPEHLAAIVSAAARAC